MTEKRKRSEGNSLFCAAGTLEGRADCETLRSRTDSLANEVEGLGRVDGVREGGTLLS